MQSQRLPAEMDKDSRAGSQGVTRGASRGAGSPQAKAGPDSPGGGGRAADVAGSESRHSHVGPEGANCYFVERATWQGPKRGL